MMVVNIINGNNNVNECRVRVRCDTIRRRDGKVAME